MIEQLRKQERQWRWAKWVLLLGGAFLCGCYLLMLLWVTKAVSVEEFGESAALIYAMVFPKAYVMIAAAAILMGWAIRDWRGNTTRTLLLKLIDQCDRERK